VLEGEKAVTATEELDLDAALPGDPGASAPSAAHPLGGSWATAIPLGVFLLALSVRLVFVCAFHSPQDHVFSDMWVYDHRARDLLSGTLDAWDTFTPVGYPATLALVYGLHGSALVVGVLQALLGAATALLTTLLAARVFARRSVALGVGLVCALHVPAVYYSGLLLTETLFSFLVVAAVWSLVTSVEHRSKVGFVITGLLLGYGASVRPNLLVFLPCVPLLLWLGSGRRLAQVAVPTLLIGAAFALPVGAAALHNARLLGHPSLGSNGGLNFYLNFAPVRGVRYAEGRMIHRITPIPNLLRYPSDDAEEAVAVPFYSEAHYYARGLTILRQHPERLAIAASNLVEAAGGGRQGYWPSDGRDPFLRSHRRIFLWACILPGLFGLGALATRRRYARAENLTLVACAALVLTGLVTLLLFLGDPRMRVPFDPLFILLAAAAYVALAELVERRFGVAQRVRQLLDARRAPAP
jgi:4-amino-4-deoxy-L-arabinose transferase-like glycosyltransferase